MGFYAKKWNVIVGGGCLHIIPFQNFGEKNKFIQWTMLNKFLKKYFTVNLFVVCEKASK